MTNTELNRYILHYLDKVLTKSAIMLTAGWGTGKSYYIQNELIPFLGYPKNGSHACIVVSLYGLKEISEISKVLYLEIRMKPLTKKVSPIAGKIESLAKKIRLPVKESEAAATGKFLVKTIASNLMNVSMNDANLQELYQSIDLTGKLIILEDIERSGIDILDVLGYVYNLIEEDGAKVLLVANEDAITNYPHTERDKSGNIHKIPDEDTVAYLKIKEKTISDTISFHGNIKEAIEELIRSFDNKILNRFAVKDQVEKIHGLMIVRNHTNLRTFIFACQKASDIFNKLGSITDDVAQTIFYGVLSLSMRIKSGANTDWDGTDFISATLGAGNFPLYRFCYDYIKFQKLDVNGLQPAIDDHENLKLYNRHAESAGDEDLSTIFRYYIHSEEEVLTALKNIESRLDNSKGVPIYCYSKLAYSLVKCHAILGFNYASCKEKMVSNMRQHGENIDSEILFLNIFEFDDKDQKQQFDDFSQVLRDAANDSANTAHNFTYIPEDISALLDDVTEKTAQIAAEHVFISKFDLAKLVEMLLTCSPSQLHDWRDVLFTVYRYSTKTDFFETDRLFMEELIARINEASPEKKAAMDKIALYQLGILVDNLSQFVEQLS